MRQARLAFFPCFATLSFIMRIRIGLSQWNIIFRVANSVLGLALLGLLALIIPGLW